MDPVQSMREHLGRIRAMYGEDKYRYAAAHSARMILAQDPSREADIREALNDIVDLDELLKGPAPAFPGMNVGLPPEDMMAAALRQQMPGIQTQAQFNVAITAFDIMKTTLNSIFLGKKEDAAKNREALLKVLETAEQATDLSVKLHQVPEAATSKEAEEFKKPPAQFNEYDTMKSLLIELDTIQTVEHFKEWYASNRTKFDQVVSQSYRNNLFDTIRAKQSKLVKSS